MATLREYFEKDFGHNFRFHIKLPFRDSYIEGAILYDFAGFFAFSALYVPGEDKDLQFFLNLISEIEYGKTRVHFDGKVSLPPAKEFPGRLLVQNKADFEMLGQYFGDTEWMSTKNMPTSSRIFVYSESDLPADQIAALKASATERGLDVHFRSQTFVRERNKYEPPLAFICHDSRDKDAVAEKIAVNLQRMLCTVWYDEFSLRVGDNLRDSIEKGLKECKKCILILSPNFISNKGWTKTEFDSIFTRQILEEKKPVLPVWYQVNKKDVYEYSPSLAGVYGLDWERLGEEKVCQQLYSVIMDE